MSLKSAAAQTGLIEIETGLPIGHLSMVCDHARGGGVATWLLEESAIHFHDSHCVNCSMRKPLRLPNISKLIERRDRDAVLERIRNEELQQQQQAAFDARCAAITALRTKSPVAVATFLDDLQAFDVKRDEALAHKLIESARLAPELLTEEITEHLFSLLESGELWFDAVGLSVGLSSTEAANAYSAFAGLVRIVDALVKWRSTVLEAQPEADRFLRSARERHTLWLAEYQGKPFAAVAKGKRTVILCVLDSSQKSTAPRSLDDLLDIRFHRESGITICVLVIQGGLAKPSALSR